MASIKDIIEPIKIYKLAKETYHQNAVDYFNKLIKDTNTDENKNKATCEAYYQKLIEIEDANKRVSKKGKFKTFLRVLEIICYCLVILIPVGLLIHSRIKNNINSSLKEMNEELNKLNQESLDLKKTATQESSQLNNAFTWNMAANLFTETIPLIKTDRYFSMEKLQCLIDKYGFKEHISHDISTLFVQSGSILGNPFIIEQNFVQEMLPFTYTGTLVIHYTTYVRDSNGHSHMVHHTQTLVAHLEKPKPNYFVETWLIYASSAAPNLTFSRVPSKNSNLNDKQLNKSIAKFNKDLARRAKKDMSFTRMANDKFETLFNATDRDNEVEFRLLFTPLGQANMIDLIRNQEPYGDDFSFYKNKKLNYIKTEHAQHFDYSMDPIKFINFDVSKSKEAFINYCDEYFQNFFFDLAPLLSIPLYQNFKAQEYIYKDNHKSRFTSFEIESLANKYESTSFAPKNNVTDLILKSEFIKREGNNDIINITAYGFKTIPHVDYVPVMGGDGRLHNVPVPWNEYVEVRKTTPIIMKDSKMSREEILSHKNIFANSETKKVYYQKGLVSTLNTYK